MQIGRLVLALSLLAVLSSDARASGPRLVIVQPAERYLVFDHTPYDQPSATQRVLVRNDGDPVGFEYISVGPPFEIVATGGGVGKGHRHIQVPTRTPVGSLWSTVANRYGVTMERFGDATGMIDGIF